MSSNFLAYRGCSISYSFSGFGKVENVKMEMNIHNVPLNRFDTQSRHTSEGLRVGLNMHFVPSKIWLHASLSTS